MSFPERTIEADIQLTTIDVNDVPSLLEPNAATAPPIPPPPNPAPIPAPPDQPPEFESVPEPSPTPTPTPPSGAYAYTHSRTHTDAYSRARKLETSSQDSNSAKTPPAKPLCSASTRNSGNSGSPSERSRARWPFFASPVACAHSK